MSTTTTPARSTSTGAAARTPAIGAAGAAAVAGRTPSNAAAGGAGGAAAGGGAAGAGATPTRRRLSVVSDNKLIDGVAGGAAAEVEAKTPAVGAKSLIREFYGASKKGYAPMNRKKRNQDAIVMEEDAATASVLFGVLDGHGEQGDLVSHYISERLPARLFKNAAWVADPVKAIKEEVSTLEKAILRDASIDTDFSGTTCVISVVRGNTLYVANIGDSRIILGSSDTSGRITAVEVSIDHKPDRDVEQKRILAAGGRVFAVEYDDGETGPPRVWLAHLDIPGLAMSRSIGDSVAHSVGVTSEPEVFQVTLTDKHRMLVMASDGLWEFMSNQEVLDMIVSTGAKKPKAAVDVLVAEASARWMAEESVIDDTTIILAYFR